MKKIVFALFLGAVACQPFRPEQQPVENIAGRLSVTIDPSRLSQSGLLCPLALEEFYRSRGFASFWVDRRDSSHLADTLFRVLSRADLFGLSPDDYHLAELTAIMTDTLSPENQEKLDILLSDSYLALYTHLADGRLDPGTLRRRDLRQWVDTAALASFDSIHIPGALDAVLRHREPVHKAYHLLKAALQGISTMKDDSLRAVRARIIGLNMERWRWQGALPSRYVFVNIPGFSMRVVESDSVWMSSRVIVGKRETPTPEMESVIRSFVIYPYWHAPFSIATKEILPALQADAAYLTRNNFEVLDRRGRLVNADTIRWVRYSPEYFPFILRQREGVENSMGIIKFNFANSHGVYLHDTNSRRLFNLANRNLSHGCIRVDKAADLARYLVRDDDIYVSPEDLDQYLSLQQRLQIDLRSPVPLKLAYFTAEVVHDTALFYDDIYKKDSLMMEVLRKEHVSDTVASAGPL